MVPIDRSCSNATLQPNICIQKFNIFWLSLCITHVTPPHARLPNFNLWRSPTMFSRDLLYKRVLFIEGSLYNRFLWGISYIIGSNDFRRVESVRLPSQHDSRPHAKSGNIGARGINDPLLESWDPQLSIDPTFVLCFTYYVPFLRNEPLREWS